VYNHTLPTPTFWSIDYPLHGTQAYSLDVFFSCYSPINHTPWRCINTQIIGRLALKHILQSHIFLDLGLGGKLCLALSFSFSLIRPMRNEYEGGVLGGGV
jgi:hypothetical protein